MLMGFSDGSLMYFSVPLLKSTPSSSKRVISKLLLQFSYGITHMNFLRVSEPEAEGHEVALAILSSKGGLEIFASPKGFPDILHQSLVVPSSLDGMIIPSGPHVLLKSEDKFFLTNFVWSSNVKVTHTPLQQVFVPPARITIAGKEIGSFVSILTDGQLIDFSAIEKRENIETEESNTSSAKSAQLSTTMLGLEKITQEREKLNKISQNIEHVIESLNNAISIMSSKDKVIGCSIFPLVSLHPTFSGNVTFRTVITVSDQAFNFDCNWYYIIRIKCVGSERKSKAFSSSLESMKTFPIAVGEPDNLKSAWTLDVPLFLESETNVSVIGSLYYFPNYSSTLGPKDEKLRTMNKILFRKKFGLLDFLRPSRSTSGTTSRRSMETTPRDRIRQICAFTRSRALESGFVPEYIKTTSEASDPRQGGKKEDTLSQVNMSIGEDGETRVYLKPKDEETRSEGAKRETLAELFSLVPSSNPHSSSSSSSVTFAPSVLLTHPKTASLSLPFSFILSPALSKFIRSDKDGGGRDSSKKEKTGSTDIDKGEDSSKKEKIGSMDIDGSDIDGSESSEESVVAGIPIETLASFLVISDISDSYSQQAADHMIFLDGRDACAIFGETLSGETVHIKIKKLGSGDVQVTCQTSNPLLNPELHASLISKFNEIFSEFAKGQPNQGETEYGENDQQKLEKTLEAKSTKLNSKLASIKDDINSVLHKIQNRKSHNIPFQDTELEVRNLILRTFACFLKQLDMAAAKYPWTNNAAMAEF
eukprot:TRINITY_DN5587_c0_g1_i1.p1 TRINITY_DN5587_c0_g1~~TRINITY_DN5587_c0_g1_i1.p1  ORF type:complete len:761 (+),score=127.31 TRINITY_DN5587_c0_g1_i1:767-3049(+)